MAIINKGMSRRSFLGLTGSVAAVAGLGLTGCGGSSSDEGSASGSTDSANRGGGVITAGSAYAPSSFDPASTGSAVGLGANWHVVEGLYGIDYHDYSTFNELATDDPKSVDDTTFEVTIRKGAKFSDGTEVTADDVVASYTACAASATYAPFFQPFESIEAKDASTVTVKTKVPNFSPAQGSSGHRPRYPGHPDRGGSRQAADRFRPLDVRLYLRYRDHPGSQPRVQR